MGLATLGRGWRSAELFQHTALVSRVFSFLMDGAEVVEGTLAVSTRGGGRPKLAMDLILDVVGDHTS
jgi:hypothetical protein